MARARNLKPSFFLNTELAKIEPLGRLLFAGLWCIADREGRLEDNSLKIKAQVLPYDNTNVDDLLTLLHNGKLILRYQKRHEKYIQIINFKKHQYPHIKESTSTIPAPDKHSSKSPSSLIPIQPKQLNPESLNLLQRDGLKIPENLKSNEPEIMAWLAYKRERGEGYKPRGLQALWKRLEAIPQGRRKEAIELSMSNNWAGIFPPKGDRETVKAPKAGDFVPSKRPV